MFLFFPNRNFLQVRGRSASADQPDMVQNGDHPVCDRAWLRSVPNHLHTQLPIIQPVLPGGDIGRDRKPAGRLDRVDDGQQHRSGYRWQSSGCGGESDNCRWR